MLESDIIICGHGSGNPSTKNMSAYLTSRYNQFASNGKRKGLVAVRRFKALTDKDRERFTETYSTILGRNIYSQSLRQYVYTSYGGKYYSDCSSSICATYSQIGKKCGLLNTAGIYESDLFEDVNAKISEGHVTNPDVLKVGDCLLFVGNDPSRPLQIGHVEAVYQMPAELPVYTIEATLMVTASSLNIRTRPNANASIIGAYAKGTIVKANAKSGEWFRTDRGWISRKYVRGWIKEPQVNAYKNYWYIDNGVYPIECIMEIGGEEYAFDKDGWMIESKRINSAGAIMY